jgi:glycosyltransferase involved in cell wall biosynthesis
MRISIVTAYYNRKLAFWRTLKTIEKSEFKDFEFIVVDDASDSNQRVEDFAEKFKFMKLIRIEPQNKRHINPCIPFNMGFGKARGDIVIIQNPECMHMGDVLSFVANNSKENQYLVFSCYSLGEMTSNKLGLVDFNSPAVNFELDIINTVGGFVNRNCDDVGRYDSWFAHPVYRRTCFNFLTSMPMKDLRDLGGFDERFAEGFAFDDTDFVSRVQKKGMDIKIIEKPFCLHQYHPPFLHHVSNFRVKELRNKQLYEEAVKSSNYKVKNSFWEKV